MNLGNYIIILGTIVIVITLLLLFSLFLKKDLSNSYIKLFWFTLLGLFLSINSILYTFFLIPERKYFFLIQQLLAITQLTILGEFFFVELKKMFYIKVLFIVAIFFSLYIIYQNYISSYSYNFKHINVFFNFPLILLCVQYYRGLLKSHPFQNLTQSPLFWITTGTFFYSCTSIPVYSLVNFIRFTTETKILRNDLFHISNISLIMLYACIIKASLCLKKMKNAI